MKIIQQPSDSMRLGDVLMENFSGPWTHFRAAVAFVKQSGTKHVKHALADFAQNNEVEIIAGIDHHGTSAEGLQDLLEAVSPNGRVIVFHNPLKYKHTFHPKLYLFKCTNSADITIGSGNFTQGGLFENYEVALRLRLDLNVPDHTRTLQSIEHMLDHWADLSSGTAHVLDDSFLSLLTVQGHIPQERIAVTKPAGMEQDGNNDLPISQFTPRTEHRAPAAPKHSSKVEKRPRRTELLPMGFVMTLQQTDVGVGQTSTGTARRSPEIFIPLSARNLQPDFWGWKDAFNEDPEKPGKFDRIGVRMRLAGTVIKVNMMTWPDKHDFRLRSEALRSAGEIGDILRMEKMDSAAGYDYYVEVIPQGTSQYSLFLALCSEPVRNSLKKYGYY